MENFNNVNNVNNVNNIYNLEKLKTLDNILVPPLYLKELDSSVAVPGSKSITNRALLLASLCQQSIKIYHSLYSEDTHIMLQALQNLGVEIQQQSDYIIITSNLVEGIYSVKKANLFMGNAGTAIRPLCAVLALTQGEYILDGIERMRQRPIADLVEGLQSIGANIAYLNNHGYPPILIKPAKLHSNHIINIKANTSSQFLSSILMAAPLLSTKNDVIINITSSIISRPYVQITLDVMQQFGVVVIKNNDQFIIPQSSIYRAPENNIFMVEGDASSASYMIAAGILGGKVTISNLNNHSIQGDIAFVQAAQKMGANIEINNNNISAYKSTNLYGAEIDCLDIPDAAMTLCILALFASGSTKLTNIASWKVKETDRILAMHNELSKLGAVVVSGADFIHITPPTKLIQPLGGIDTYDDHRMAMCFSLCAFSPQLQGIKINNPSCVAKTYPNFFVDLLVGLSNIS